MAKHALEIENTKKDIKELLLKEVSVSQELLKKIFTNLLKAIGMMLYFIVLNLANCTMNQDRLIADIEVFAGVFLVVGILFLEKAYKEDKEEIFIIGVEFLVLSLHSLSIMHVITLFKYNFSLYLLTSSYIIASYFVLKAIIIYTKGRKEYLNSLSDISEIVKKEEPIKKEAKKKNKSKEKETEENKKEEKEVKEND